MNALLILAGLLSFNIAFSQGLGVNKTRVKPLIVITGESNAGGRGSNSDATSAEKAKRTSYILNNVTLKLEQLQVGVNNTLLHTNFLDALGYHGWEIQLANQVDSGTFISAPMYFLKAGMGGSTISQWTVGNVSGYWDSLQKRMDTAITLLTTLNQGRRPDIYIFYTQGINDILNGVDTATWRVATEAHFSKIRAKYGHVPIFMTYLPTFQPGYPQDYNPVIDRIAAEMTEVYPIKTDDASKVDSAHWDYAGLKLVARRMIAALLANYTL